MLTLITAALVAAQPAPPAETNGQMAPMQHEAMKDCCKHMADKHCGQKHGTHAR